MTSTWRAPHVERSEPARIGDERPSLEQWLDYHRATLLMKCAGLTAAQLRLRSVPPSALSLLGLVRHMTEVEQWWFRMHVGGVDAAFPYDPDGVGRDFADVDDADDAAVAAAFTAYEKECDLSRSTVAERLLDDVVPSRGDHPERTRDLRWIFTHMIEEYARHNGHADLLREAIDGTTGD